MLETTYAYGAPGSPEAPRVPGALKGGPEGLVKMTLLSQKTFILQYNMLEMTRKASG